MRHVVPESLRDEVRFRMTTSAKASAGAKTTVNATCRTNSHCLKGALARHRESCVGSRAGRIGRTAALVKEQSSCAPYAQINRQPSEKFSCVRIRERPGALLSIGRKPFSLPKTTGLPYFGAKPFRIFPVYRTLFFLGMYWFRRGSKRTDQRAAAPSCVKIGNLNTNANNDYAYAA